jgi:hypothetical protein
MLRINSENGTASLGKTSISDQDLLEDDLRDWILDDQKSILGEDLLLIGREVIIKEIRDAIDLLAIDRDGNIVIIELKKGRISGNVDFQALKYAAYTSYWSYDQLRDQFKKFKSTNGGQNLYDVETTFTEALDEFCNDDYTLNQDQRIMLVGESVEERLDLVARWLSDRDIDVTVVEVQLFEDDDRLYLDAEQTIPISPRAVSDVSPDTSEQPWKEDGRNWHLNEVSNDKTSELLAEVAARLEDIEFLDGPDWGQKHYLSFKQDRKIRIALRTKRTLFHVDVYDISAEEVDVESLASSLGIDVDAVRAEEEDLRSGRSGIRITFHGDDKPDVDALSDAVRDLLEDEMAD